MGGGNGQGLKKTEGVTRPAAAGFCFTESRQIPAREFSRGWRTISRLRDVGDDVRRL
jgi:hypothetical protein